MIFSTRFVSATHEKSTTKKNVAAPYLRRTVIFDKVPEKTEITVCGLGFYELYVNGKRITKGHMSPYIVNPDQVLPYDSYDITDMMVYGENVFAFILGNGMQNAFGGFIWDFQKARFNSAPKLAFALEMTADGKKSVIEADESLLCHPSPFYFDDLRMGEKYDARREIPNWNMPGCDLSDWTPAIPVQTDCGEPMLSCNKPIVATGEMKAVAITKEDDGYLYDFGYDCVGLTRLTVKGNYGQHIRIDHGELIMDGRFSQANIVFRQPNQLGEPKYTQRTEYICHGGETETHMPSFTYYGFRYAKVTGITEEQATPDLLTYVVMNTELGDRGDFKCSDETLNTLQEMTRRSTLGNFQHFPNDCPHREKNGWTADAALSAEQTIMNFEPEDNYLMWEKCIVRAMDNRGALPGIVPTGGWGFAWGNGPAWDSVLIYLPYFAAVLRDDLRIAKEASGAMLRYFHYLRTRLNDMGLLEIGLGDWCPADPNYTTPLIFTDSTISYDLANKAAYLYDRLGKTLEAEYCRGFAKEMRTAIRKYLLEDAETMRFNSGRQTVQAMAIFYGLCDSEEEKQKAFAILLDEIHKKDDHMGVGVLGGRVIFRVLCDFGYEDLAIKMITRPDQPSYGCMIADGLTTLAENVRHSYDSLNHHFWGDISALMIEYFAGIRVNPDLLGAEHINIAPVFASHMSFAEAYHKSVCGRVDVKWQKSGEEIKLTLIYPEDAKGYVIAPIGYTVNGADKAEARSGEFVFVKNN
ncbi:MAG: family 78 glycoside hydrolase catalytic domain [Clostridia bacterium]|nr:family 78 glycoside hydrolase catalytic domain [Clostridia bacterium]